MTSILYFDVVLTQILFVQTNELYQLASVAFCLLVAWVCFISEFFTSIWITWLWFDNYFSLHCGITGIGESCHSYYWCFCLLEVLLTLLLWGIFFSLLRFRWMPCQPIMPMHLSNYPLHHTHVLSHTQIYLYVLIPMYVWYNTNCFLYFSVVISWV